MAKLSKPGGTTSSPPPSIRAQDIVKKYQQKKKEKEEDNNGGSLGPFGGLSGEMATGTTQDIEKEKVIKSADDKQDVIDPILLDGFLSDLKAVSASKIWAYYLSHPSPLYLNHNVVFEKPLMLMNALGQWIPTGPMPENHDPLRPYVGHWRKLASFEKSEPIGVFQGTTFATAWFHTTNNLKSPADPQYYDFTDPGSRIFIRPYEYSWLDIGADDPAVHKSFRFLATDLVQIQPTEEITDEWETALHYYNLYFDPTSPAHQGHMKTLINSAIDSGPLPHSHTGYVDANGVGFTVSMDIPSKWKELHKAAETLVPDRTAAPMYHTHTFIPNSTKFSDPSHENAEPYEQSGLYSEWKGADSGIPDTLMALGTHPDNYIPLQDVGSTVFLESMHLYYNNNELNKILRLTQQDLDDGLVPQLDKDPEDSLWLDLIEGFVTGPAAEIREHIVHEKYYYKRQKLKKHFLDRYISKMHTISSGYKNMAAYKIFQDKVFNPRTLKNQMSLGFRESVLNYFPSLYEKAVHSLPLGHEKLIPNPYLFGQFKEDPNRFQGTFNPYGDLLSLGVKTLLVDQTMDSYLYKWSQVVNDKMKNYKWTDEIYKISGLANTIQAVFAFPEYEFMAKYNPTPHTFPWYSRLVINTPSPVKNPSSEFPDNRGTFINDTFAGLYDNDFTKTKKDELMLFFMAKVANKNSSTSVSIGDQYYKQDFHVRNIDVASNNNLEKVEIETFNFTDFALGHTLDSQEYDLTSNQLISFDLDTEQKYNQTTAQNIENAFIEFRDKIEEFPNTRSIYEILDVANTQDMEKYGYTMQPFAHNEIMFYEIEKWGNLLPGVGAKEAMIVLDRYFIAPPRAPSAAKLDSPGVIEFIDSQIKVDKGYQYKVNVYVLVVGNKYQYADIQTRGLKLLSEELNVEEDGPGTPGPIKYWISTQQDNKFSPIADIFVLNRPNIELLKIPYISFQTLYVTNRPPLYPNVVIYPYKNVNNKLLFTLSQFVGKRTEKPIEILPGDKEIFMKAALSQEKMDAEDQELPAEIEFMSDEPDLKYQVFRVEEHPSGWSDFSTALRKPVLLPGGSYRELGQHEKDFVENLSPNKKYYYTFRTIDPQGYISNPSPIYEVELVDDSGAVYLITKIVTFKPKIPKENTKSMRKYVHIVPTLKQSNLQAPPGQSIYTTEGLDQDVNLGDLFGTRANPRRFKIRFTSKSSGKKFDLNLNFVHSPKDLIQVDKDTMENWAANAVDKAPSGLKGAPKGGGHKMSAADKGPAGHKGAPKSGGHKGPGGSAW